MNLNFFQKNSVTTYLISRKSQIIPKFIGLNFNVHNGKKYHKLMVTEKMLGYKFGEFSFTRSQCKNKKQKNGSKN